MSSQDEAIRNLEARAREMTEHLGDIDFVVAHKDLLRALILVRALNDDDTVLGTITETLRHGENALLVKLLATGQLGKVDPSHYVTALSVFVLFELESQKEVEYLYEDMWALSVLISKHYEPVPYAPYTREQLIQGMQDEPETPKKARHHKKR
jgi:hypothetical protein